MVVQKQEGRVSTQAPLTGAAGEKHRGRALEAYSTELFSLRAVVKAEVNDDHVVSHGLTIPMYLAFLLSTWHEVLH